MKVPLPLISAETWNAFCRAVQRAAPLPGPGVRVHRTPEGCILTLAEEDDFPHPWQLAPRWVPDAEVAEGGRWQSPVRPGFVNGRDVSIEVERTPRAGGGVTRTHELLFAEPAPELVFRGYRNPALGTGAEVNARTGDLSLAAAEGYPRFFDELGVVPAQKRRALSELLAPPDPDRTRQIRAADVVLVTPRLGARQEVTLKNPFTDAQIVEIGTVYDFEAVNDAPSRHWVEATNKHEVPPAPTALDRLLGTAVEPTTDRLKLATLYLVSPPDPEPTSDEDAKGVDEMLPDGTWEPFVQNHVFWNLLHASRAVPALAPPKPIELKTGLLGGTADLIFSTLLQPVNDAYAAIFAQLNSADFSGRYWT